MGKENQQSYRVTSVFLKSKGEKGMLKELYEKRAQLVEKMNAALDTAKAEKRAMTEEESKTFESAEAEIAAIDKTIEAEERAQKLSVVNHPAPDNKDTLDNKVTDEQKEERAFADFIRGNAEELRAGEVQLTQGLNGSIVPTKIADRIIKAVKDKVPFLQYADVVYTNGKLSVPVYGEDATTHINADYVDEGSALTDNVGKFTTVDLTGYVVGALSLVSNKLVTNTDFDIVSFVVNQVAEALANKLEAEFVKGSTKIKGVATCTQSVTAASASAITYDELVTVKHTVKQAFQANAVWIMAPSTYTALCKLKDGENRPYFEDDKYMILGRPVLTTDSMDEIGASKTTIVFGDLSGYTIKGAKNVEVTLLKEKYAERNMLGVIGYAEFDADITDQQKLVKLVMKNA